MIHHREQLNQISIPKGIKKRAFKPQTIGVNENPGLEVIKLANSLRLKDKRNDLLRVNSNMFLKGCPLEAKNASKN